MSTVQLEMCPYKGLSKDLATKILFPKIFFGSAGRNRGMGFLFKAELRLLLESLQDEGLLNTFNEEAHS